MDDESYETGRRDERSSLTFDIAYQFSGEPNTAESMDDLLAFFRRITGDEELEWPRAGAERPPVALPADLDPECRELCEALNLISGITTTSSCCGHGREPYRIFFRADSLDDLPPVCWYADGCHSGEYGWRVYAFTDCAMKPVDFVLEGPGGAYGASGKIAALIREQEKSDGG